MAGLPQDKIDALTKRFDSIEAALSAGPSAEAFVRLSKEYAELEPIVRPIKAYLKLAADLESAGEEAIEETEQAAGEAGQAIKGAVDEAGQEIEEAGQELDRKTNGE